MQQHRNKHRVVILQHPQEQDTLLGSAPLLCHGLERVQLIVGLSWPSLSKALQQPQQAKNWAILYPAALPKGLTKEKRSAPWLVDKHGTRLSLEKTHLEGILLLDGTWSQAKSLWWRNPWMLKLPRLLLSDTQNSIYGKVRREPKPGYVSTLEAAGAALTALGEDENIAKDLNRVFRTLIQRIRDQHTATGRSGQ